MGLLQSMARFTLQNWPRFAALLLYWPMLWRHRLGPRRTMTRLHVGCGRNHFDGWINADIDPRADLAVFLEKPLPFTSSTLDRIYSEHVLEHTPFTVGKAFLREAHRVLKPGGVIRIAMPDLEQLVAGYSLQDWRERLDWVGWPEYGFIQTRAEMINIGFRWWGHRHLYDREELQRALRESGFTQISFPRMKESQHADLCGLETRKDSALVAEAIR